MIIVKVIVFLSCMISHEHERTSLQIIVTPVMKRKSIFK